jgi:hypothetical protein
MYSHCPKYTYALLMELYLQYMYMVGGEGGGPVDQWETLSL